MQVMTEKKRSSGDQQPEENKAVRDPNSCQLSDRNKAEPQQLKSRKDDDGDEELKAEAAADNEIHQKNQVLFRTENRLIERKLQCNLVEER